ncbi:MAG TPA: phosphoglucosamine mutase [Usitatibacteraceae bacterium]|nr:phosphoglucosamine mutase [Usitatibacteraceae bacterium]
MSRKYFGTDGVRGRVGESPITPEFVLRLGYAAGCVLAQEKADGRARPTVIIGKDTRISGYMIESALEAGLSAAGVDVLLIGPMPTPGVAYLTRALRLNAGVMISASHNPFDDNGIKFFSAEGLKLPDEVEFEIEAQLDKPIATLQSINLGKVRRVEDAGGRYIEFCKSTFPRQLDLKGLRLVVDCANGAAWDIAPHVFRELGAEVIAVGNTPDGTNINDEVGATHPAAMRAAVKTHRADFGIAVDGDADRLVMCDADGTLFDGDQLLYAMVKDRHARGVMRGGVVGTLMTNFALEQQLAKLGIPFARAKVGDRYILEMLKEKGWEVGGENSGHLLCLEKHSTGDGIISALQILGALRRGNHSLREFTAELTLYPQVLENVRTAKRFDFAASLPVKEAVKAAEADLKGEGRVLLRASGTEPVIRVMVEGPDSALVKALAQRVAGVVKQAAA